MRINNDFDREKKTTRKFGVKYISPAFSLEKKLIKNVLFFLLQILFLLLYFYFDYDYFDVNERIEW